MFTTLWASSISPLPPHLCLLHLLSSKVEHIQASAWWVELHVNVESGFKQRRFGVLSVHSCFHYWILKLMSHHRCSCLLNSTFPYYLNITVKQQTSTVKPGKLNDGMCKAFASLVSAQIFMLVLGSFKAPWLYFCWVVWPSVLVIRLQGLPYVDKIHSYWPSLVSWEILPRYNINKNKSYIRFSPINSLGRSISPFWAVACMELSLFRVWND